MAIDSAYCPYCGSFMSNNYVMSKDKRVRLFKDKFATLNFRVMRCDKCKLYVLVAAQHDLNNQGFV